MSCRKDVADLDIHHTPIFSCHCISLIIPLWHIADAKGRSATGSEKLPYTLVATPAQFRNLPYGRRKAIEVSALLPRSPFCCLPLPLAHVIIGFADSRFLMNVIDGQSESVARGVRPAHLSAKHASITRSASGRRRRKVINCRRRPHPRSAAAVDGRCVPLARGRGPLSSEQSSYFAQ